MSKKKGRGSVLVVVARSFLRRPMYDSIQWRLSGNFSLERKVNCLQSILPF